MSKNPASEDLDELLSEISRTLIRIKENNEKTKYQNIKQLYERRLQQLLFATMYGDFYIQREVRGNFIISNTPVRIDCCMFPKQHLIEKGFVDQWIGVEVKVPEPNKARAGKGGQVLWQSVIYSQSTFAVAQNPKEAEMRTKVCVPVRPAFILIFPRLIKSFEGSTFLTPPEATNLGLAFEAFAQSANVGSLELSDEGWTMLGATNYFRRKNNEFQLSSNGLLKRNVGSKR